MALSIQAAEQQAQLQVAANTASHMGSDCMSDSDSGSATLPDLVSSEPSDEEQTDHDDATASESESMSTAALGVALLAQHAVATNKVRQQQTAATKKAKKTAPQKGQSRRRQRKPPSVRPNGTQTTSPAWFMPLHTAQLSRQLPPCSSTNRCGSMMAH